MVNISWATDEFSISYSMLISALKSILIVEDFINSLKNGIFFQNYGLKSIEQVEKHTVHCFSVHSHVLLIQCRYLE